MALVWRKIFIRVRGIWWRRLFESIVPSSTILSRHLDNVIFRVITTPDDYYRKDQLLQLRRSIHVITRDNNNRHSPRKSHEYKIMERLPWILVWVGTFVLFNITVTVSVKLSTSSYGVDLCDRPSTDPCSPGGKWDPLLERFE